MGSEKFRSEKIIGVKKWLLLFLLFTIHYSLFTANAQTHLFGVGPAHLLDTYLSQEKFKGTGLTYLHIREPQIKEGKHWHNIIQHEIDLSKANDRSHSISMLEGDYNFYWGRYRRFALLGDESTDLRLHLDAGGLVNANLGFIYAMLNTNNPAQMRLGMNLMPSAFATFGFPLFRQRFSLRYEVEAQLLGLVFSPNYGQSYYEIFSRGNYDHNIVPTTTVSAPNLRQMLTLEWQTGRKWNLRIGYLGNYQQAAVNNLKQHVYTHRFVIGIARSL